MTREELIEFACEVTASRVTDLSADQMQKLTAIVQSLSRFGSDEFESFGQLCALRADIDDAVTEGAGDVVTVRLERQQWQFLLALIDRAIREHA